MGDHLDRSDADLLGAVADGDPSALRALYERHAAWVSVRLMRRCNDAGLVAEVLQDTFVAVWRGARVSIAALLRRHDMAAPGHTAGGVTVLGTLVFVGVDPLHRWAPALPDDQHVAHTTALWIVIGVAAIVITIISTRDPGRPTSSPRTRTDRGSG